MLLLCPSFKLNPIQRQSSGDKTDGGGGVGGGISPAAQRMSTAFREGDSSVLTRSLPALFTFSSCTERSASSSCSS